MKAKPARAKKDFQVGQRFVMLGHVVKIVAITKRGLALRFINEVSGAVGQVSGPEVAA